MITGKSVAGFLISGACLLLSACDSGSSSGSQSSAACPLWQVGDSMTYQTTETINGVPTTTSATWTITTHTATSVTMSDGTLGAVYGVQEDTYIPQSEERVIHIDYSSLGVPPYDYIATGNYTSATYHCPTPAVGEIYSYSTWIPGPVVDTGDYLITTITVNDKKDEVISVGSDSFTATTLVMDKTEGSYNSTITCYLVNGIGMVKEVEDIPSTNTTITKELITYSYQ